MELDLQQIRDSSKTDNNIYINNCRKIHRSKYKLLVNDIPQMVDALFPYETVKYVQRLDASQNEFISISAIISNLNPEFRFDFSDSHPLSFLINREFIHYSWKSGRNEELWWKLLNFFKIKQIIIQQKP